MIGFSVDVKDPDYSLPIDKVLCCVEKCIDDFGCVAFQNAAGVSASSFLEILSFYLQATFIGMENLTSKRKGYVLDCELPHC